MLDSLPEASPVLIVDAYSTDQTLAVARERGAHAVQREWRGFIDARLFALSKVTTPWTLMIDADEALDAELRFAIVNAPDDVDGYRVARTSFFCRRPMRIWSAERILRLFRTDRASLRSQSVHDTAQVHEIWTVPGAVRDLDGTLLHDSYPTVAAYHEKYAQYTALEALAVRPKKRQLGSAYVATFVRFVWLLFGRGSIADGWRGVFIAWWSARYPLTVLEKAYRAN